MLSREEQKKLQLITRTALVSGEGAVSSDEKQWVLDVVKREKISLPLEVIETATAAGFETDGISSTGEETAMR